MVRTRSAPLERVRRRYYAELSQRPEAWEPIVAAARRGNVTLLYSARDEEHNAAVALRDYLKAKITRSRRATARSRR